MSIREEAVTALVKKAQELFMKDPSSLGPETRFEEDLGAKSVNYVQFSAVLEELYEVEVPYMEFKRKKTFGEAADYIVKLVGE
jgi:acyl carrier protein